MENPGDIEDFQHLSLETTADGKVRMSDELMKKLILWHRRLCYPSTERLIWTIKRSKDIDIRPEDVEGLPCTVCDLAKMKKYISKNAQTRGKYSGEIIWCDVGMIQPISIEGNSYYSLTIDDSTRMKTFNAMKTKDFVQEHLTGYIQNAINKLSA